MMIISGGAAAITREAGQLKVSGTLSLKNTGAAAQLIRAGGEQHLLIDGQPACIAGGGVAPFALAKGKAQDVPFAFMVGTAATGGSKPLRLTLHAGLRVEFTADDGETVQGLTLYAGATGLLSAETLERPLAAIDRPDGQQYDIMFDVG
jgi:hypothetical protein